MPDIVGYYQQLHFQLNELELFYNLPIYDENITNRFSKCHHISKLICSHAKQFFLHSMYRRSKMSIIS